MANRWRQPRLRKMFLDLYVVLAAAVGLLTSHLYGKHAVRRRLTKKESATSLLIGTLFPLAIMSVVLYTCAWYLWQAVLRVTR